MNSNQYLIAANSKRGQLIFNIFRPIDLYIALGGGIITIILFFVINPNTTLTAVITLIPLLTCAFLVIPIPNYHNVMCVLINVYKYYFLEIQEFEWEGWRIKDEFKD